MKLGTFLNERRDTPRPAKLALLLATFFVLTTYVTPGPLPPRARFAEGRLLATPVALDPDDPTKRQAGALVFLRGWSLDSDTPRFGGISALHVEGGDVIAVSDAGDLMHFSLPGAPGAGYVRVQELTVPTGSQRRKYNRDTESIAVAGDHLWFGFERNNIVARYGRAHARPESFARPEAMRRWPRTAGSEAMVRLPDGRFLIFAEGRSEGSAYSPVALFAGDPSHEGTPAVIGRYRRPDGYRVTDAAQLPDGRLLILNRRADLFSGVSAKLVIADLPAWRSGATIEGREIATLAPPLTVDNMEALSVAQEGGRTIVRIASDDNYMRIQRTLLLEFELREVPAR